MKAPPYIELRARSAFSFLEGASLPEDLVALAAQQEHSVLALADHGGVFGAPRFFRAARKAGLRPIVGAELSLATESSADPIPVARRVLLLVETQTGYRNLCRLITATKQGQRKGEGVASHTMIAPYTKGLIALTGTEFRNDLRALRDLFGAKNLYVELQRHHDAAADHANRKALDQADALGLPVVATNDVRFARPQHRPVLDVLTCLRLHTKVDAVGRRLLRNAERRLKAPHEMAALFADCPRALAATREIADRCAFSLANLGYSFPRFPVESGQTEQGLLEQLTWEGAAHRYQPLHERARSQLAHELKIIGKLGLAGYFLVVWDIVRYARQRGILVQGRGSAANSATCYALGITAVDPVGMELLFERFLSEERVKSATDAADRMPDIDLDLPSGDRREDVIQYVYRRYGENGAAMTANVITYRPKLAVRDTGRALGFSEEQLGQISKFLPHWMGSADRPLTEVLADAGFPATDQRTRLLGQVATQLLNLPRHLGQHSGGMVICGGRLDEVVPLEPASMPGRVVVQWDKDDCADLGIVKVDLLGLGMLAVLEDAVPLILASETVHIDYAHLPPDDPKVYALLRAADTVGVFQVESRAQMATLPRMKPERFYDLVVEVAIIRPGPIVGKMVNPYLLRRQGREAVSYAHPSLEPVLRRTLGIPLFQEQLIRMAMIAAGFTGGQAEELRRAMGFKRSVERMEQIEIDLRTGMTRNGIGAAAQEQIITGIKSFALYGFPESHAASFALIAYASAYLKAHHGAAFLCALLNNYPMGFYHPGTLVSDAARHGIQTFPVDVTKSTWNCQLEKSEMDSPWGVRLGLKYVAGLRKKTGDQIETERRDVIFASLEDFLARIETHTAELQALAEVGALASLSQRGRRDALWQIQAFGKNGPLFSKNPPSQPPIDKKNAAAGHSQSGPLPPMSKTEELLAELRGTSLTTGPHPVSFLRSTLETLEVTSSQNLSTLPDGSHVRIAGVVIVRQRPQTARGVVFITLEDETGFANAVVFPDVFVQWRHVIVAHSTLVIGGLIQNRDGVVMVVANVFSAMTSPPSPHLDVSRDFH